MLLRDLAIGRASYKVLYCKVKMSWDWCVTLSRDQLYGGGIFAVSLVIIVAYVIAFFAPQLSLPMWWHEWAVGLPVLLFVLAVLVIAMWIGWTMMTTPPPLPLEQETPAEAKTEEKS
jgi:protein-S-isoprenylcysteine O-methyltransferase Ste14